MLISPAEIVPLPVEWLVNVQTRLMFFVGWLFFLGGGRHVIAGSDEVALGYASPPPRSAQVTVPR
jgi:hypothetical protein